jgi:hypothetical protein
MHQFNDPERKTKRPVGYRLVAVRIHEKNSHEKAQETQKKKKKVSRKHARRKDKTERRDSQKVTKNNLEVLSPITFPPPIPICPSAVCLSFATSREIFFFFFCAFCAFLRLFVFPLLRPDWAFSNRLRREPKRP